MNHFNKYLIYSITLFTSIIARPAIFDQKYSPPTNLMVAGSGVIGPSQQSAILFAGPNKVVEQTSSILPLPQSLDDGQPTASILPSWLLSPLPSNKMDPYQKISSADLDLSKVQNIISPKRLLADSHPDPAIQLSYSSPSDGIVYDPYGMVRGQSSLPLSDVSPYGIGMVLGTFIANQIGSLIFQYLSNYFTSHFKPTTMAQKSLSFPNSFYPNDHFLRQQNSYASVPNPTFYASDNSNLQELLVGNPSKTLAERNLDLLYATSGPVQKSVVLPALASILHNVALNLESSSQKLSEPGIFRNPCTIEALAQYKYYHSDLTSPTNYIQCLPSGIPIKRNCAPGSKWNSILVACQ